MQNLNIMVVVPTFHEASNLLELVPRVSAALTGHNCSFVFIDDDTSDGTRSACATLCREGHKISLIERQNQRGYGSAMMLGIIEASSRNPDFIITMDADLQEPPEYIPRLIESQQLNQSDYVIGGKDDSHLNDTFERSLATKTARWLAHHFAHVKPKDCTSDFRLYTKSAYSKLCLSYTREGGEVPNDDLLNLWILIQLKNLKFSEIVYPFGQRFAGTTTKSPKKRLKQYFRYFLYTVFG